MKARIRGLGVYYPETVRRNAEWPEGFGTNGNVAGDRTFNDIPVAEGDAARVTARYLAVEAMDPFLGCLERRVSDPRMTSGEAEAIAARAALQDADVLPEDVDVVLSYSITPERISPPAACDVARRIGARRAFAWAIDTACATSIAQLLTASSLIESGAAKTVLVTQSHLVLRTMPMSHPASPGLGDGATAFVMSDRGDGFRVLGTHGMTMGEFYEAVTWTRGPDDATDLPWWQAGGDFRLGSRNTAQAKELMRDTVRYGAETVREVCSKSGIDVERVDVLASVQPRGWVPPAIAECLGLSADRAVTTYERLAHLGGCGPIANLHAARSSGRLRPGSIVALYAQGAGFTRASALLGC